MAIGREDTAQEQLSEGFPVDLLDEGAADRPGAVPVAVRPADRGRSHQVEPRLVVGESHADGFPHAERYDRPESDTAARQVEQLGFDRFRRVARGSLDCQARPCGTGDVMAGPAGDVSWFVVGHGCEEGDVPFETKRGTTEA